jgi:chromosome segregation ATPase
MRSVVMILLLTWVSVGPALADDAKQNREKEALRRAQQQLQQANRERASLQEKLGQNDQEMETLKTQAQSEGRRNRELQAAMSSAREEQRLLKAKVAEQAEQLSVAAQRNAQLEQELEQSSAQRKLLESTLQARNQEISACGVKNRELYAVGNSLINTCHRGDASDAIRRLEPFAGLGRVAQENALEKARDRLDEHRLQATSEGAP